MLLINKLVDVVMERKALGATGKGDKVLSGRAAAVNRNRASAEKKENKYAKKTYNCPNCGRKITVKNNEQNVSCDACESDFSLEDLKKNDKK